MSEADDLISVIIPARNAAPFIRRTLNSVLNQTHRRLDVVVVDDGSTDDTAAILQDTVRQDERVRVLLGSGLGASASRNLAIANARGDLIAPIDSDDIWHPDKLAWQLAVMRSGSADLGFVYCWSRGIDDKDRVVLPSWNDSRARGNALRAIIVRGIAGNGSTPLIKRRFIDAVGGYDPTEALSEDWKLYTALAGVCEFDVVPAYLVGYRLHKSNATLVQATKMERAVADCTAWIQETWPDLPRRVFVDREHLANTYLAFIATRNREYGAAFRYVARALKARPANLFSVEVLRLVALIPLHAVGFRHYNWRFWDKRDFSEMPVS